MRPLKLIHNGVQWNAIDLTMNHSIRRSIYCTRRETSQPIPRVEGQTSLKYNSDYTAYYMGENLFLN